MTWYTIINFTTENFSVSSSFILFLEEKTGTKSIISETKQKKKKTISESFFSVFKTYSFLVSLSPLFLFQNCDIVFLFLKVNSWHEKMYVTLLKNLTLTLTQTLIKIFAKWQSWLKIAKDRIVFFFFLAFGTTGNRLQRKNWLKLMSSSNLIR